MYRWGTEATRVFFPRSQGVEPGETWPLTSNLKVFSIYLQLSSQLPGICVFVLKLLCSIMSPVHWTSKSHGNVIRASFLFLPPLSPPAKTICKGEAIIMYFYPSPCYQGFWVLQGRRWWKRRENRTRKQYWQEGTSSGAKLKGAQ